MESGREEGERQMKILMKILKLKLSKVKFSSKNSAKKIFLGLQVSSYQKIFGTDPLDRKPAMWWGKLFQIQ